MFAMSGGSLAHSHIAARLIAALLKALEGKNCKVSTSDLRIRVSLLGPFVYPDAAIYCGDPDLADNYRDTLLNPAAIFEVLSKSSEAYDRGEKFAFYRRIESLRDYVLISQHEARVEVFSRAGGGKWEMSEFVGTGAICRIPGVACDIALAEVFRDVVFD